MAVIDLQPAYNGQSKRHSEWIDDYNAQEGEFEGKRMISAADKYEAGKSASDDVLISLRTDYRNSGIISSTMSGYSPGDLSALVTQNFGSAVVKPTEIPVKVVRFYQSTSLPQVFNEEDGVSYLQAVFNTTDDPKTITQVLKHLSEKKAEDIRIWTPNQRDRKSHQWWDVRFMYGNGQFYINCKGRERTPDLTRGVLIDS